MSINVPAVRRAMVDVLGRIHPAATTYILVPHQPVVPCILVYPPDSIDYMVARDTDLAVFPIVVLVGPQEPNSQEILEGFMSGAGDLSVREALYADRQLAGTVSNLRLLDMTSGAYALSVGAEDSVIGAEFRVEVTA